MMLGLRTGFTAWAFVARMPGDSNATSSAILISVFKSENSFHLVGQNRLTRFNLSKRGEVLSDFILTQ